MVILKVKVGLKIQPGLHSSPPNLQTALKTVQRYSDESIVNLQDCFEITDWQMQLMVTLANTQTLLQPSCPNVVMMSSQTVNVKTFPNQKPWVNGSVWDRLIARSSAFSSLGPGT